MRLVAGALFEIGNHVRGGVVGGIAIQERQVSLPDIFHPWCPRQSQVRILFKGSGFDGRNRDRPHAVVARTQALPRSVVHDRNLRPDRAEQSRRSGVVEAAMAAHRKECDSAEFVDRTRQFHFSLPVEIAEADELEIAVVERQPDHPLIFRSGRPHLHCIGAERVGSLAIDRLSDHPKLDRLWQSEGLRLVLLHARAIAAIQSVDTTRRRALGMDQIEPWVVAGLARMTGEEDAITKTGAIG